MSFIPWSSSLIHDLDSTRYSPNYAYPTVSNLSTLWSLKDIHDLIKLIRTVNKYYRWTASYPFGLQAYYSVSGGSGSQYLVYAAAENGNGAAANSANLYPYWQYGQGFDYQYPLHYPFIASSSAHLPQHHAPPPLSFNAIPHSQPGSC